MSQTILMVASKGNFGHMLRNTFPPHKFNVVEMRTGEDALSFVLTICPALVFLDITSRGMNVFETCRKIWQSCSAPIILFSKRDLWEDEVLALDIGTEDHLFSSVGLNELEAFISHRLYRFSAGVSSFANTEMTIDFERRSSIVRGRRIYLTPKQFDLLRSLVANQGRPVTHQTLFEIGWGSNTHEHAENLRVVINQLRKKIEVDPARPRYILTEPGVGYRFQHIQEVKENNRSDTKIMLAT